jgi:hypothetical protein
MPVSRRRPSFTPTPRVWTEHQVACRLGHGESWLRAQRPELERQGFPRPDPLLGGTDADAVDLWLDRRSGIIDSSGSDPGLDERLEAFCGKVDCAPPD